MLILLLLVLLLIIVKFDGLLVVLYWLISVWMSLIGVFDLLKLLIIRMVLLGIFVMVLVNVVIVLFIEFF